MLKDLQEKIKANYRRPPIIWLSAGFAGVTIIALFVLASCSDHAPTNNNIAVSVIKVTPKDTPVIIEFVGQTESSHAVEIRARVNGFLDKRLYTEGAYINAGDMMFQMDPKPFQAQLNAEVAALNQEKARLKTAKANLVRIRPLVKLDALSQKDLDDATGREEASAAAVEMAKANVEKSALNLGYTAIASPISGVTSYARVQDGTYVGPSNSLLTYVYQIDPMWVKFSVSENDVLKYRGESKLGQFITPKDQAYDVEVVLADGSIYPEKGKLTFSDAEYNQQTGTFLVRATISNPKSLLRPGQFLRVHLLGGIRPAAILVPQQAVFEGAQGHFVWVVDEHHKAQIRNVDVGAQYQKQWFISKGLNAGDTVVVDGMIRLTANAPIKITGTT
ncbi:MAG TPA: efflux RND transporter periplasmic adaptor subunit [Gammaproteobacteria bacterium]|nr:efflux RND transporter periplasmic adaptor subunit [Gammaproteobacteria bacterium]